MAQLYTTEQSLQSVHRSQLEDRLAYVEVKQRTARASRSSFCLDRWRGFSSQFKPSSGPELKRRTRLAYTDWIKDALRGLVQHLKEAFSSFFAAGRASPLEQAPALLPETDKTAPPSASSFLAGIIKPDTDLDLTNLSQVDAEGSTTDLDELECRSLFFSSLQGGTPRRKAAADPLLSPLFSALVHTHIYSNPGRRQRALPPTDDRDLQRLREPLQPAGTQARRRPHRHQRSRIRTRYASSPAMLPPPSCEWFVPCARTPSQNKAADSHCFAFSNAYV